MENWPTVIRRLFDSKPVEIFLTGSSAKLLSKEIATSLRGRSIATEVWPFSFKEYLSAHKVESFDLPLAKKNSDTLFKYFKDYLEIGGFPEMIHSSISSDQRRQVLQEYVDVVIFRDIIERYSITNITLIKYLIKTLINNVSTLFSVNKFYNDLKSQGYHISKNTIHEYMTYIEDAFLIFNVPLYSESLRKTQISSKKIYAVDPALYAAYAMRIRNQELSSNAGHIFENFIYLTLRRAKQEIYYYVTQSGLEIDFLTISPNRTLSLYQIMWNSEDPKTLQREQRALAEAKEELGVEGQLVTPESFLSIDSHRLTF